MDVNIKILTKLNKLFNTVEEQYTDEEILKLEYVTVMSDDNVLMMVPKTNESRILIKSFVKKKEESRMVKEPVLNYLDNSKYAGNGSVFNIKYLKRIIDVLECNKESLRLTTGTDYPITLENEDFKFILAPRVSND